MRTCQRMGSLKLNIQKRVGSGFLHIATKFYQTLRNLNKKK